ncbi:MAG TPA: cobyrinate a,c-diamide synthase, partial [Actinopolymorphaceae bacterium]
MALLDIPSPKPDTPAVLIAGTHSGAGKTTVTAVLSRELRRRGLTVQPFKVGPDFIDPGYHGEAAGRRSINLDVWMMGEEGVRRVFQRWSRDADVAVIEAMGAVFDGADATDHGSAAHVARLLGVPLIVVVDVWGMTRTTAAILQGLIGFDPDANIAGCVLNRVGSPKHAQLITTAMPPALRPMVLGAVPYRRLLEIPERHLGLLTPQENEVPQETRAAAQSDAAGDLDIDRILELLGVGRAGPAAPPRPIAGSPTVCRIAIARDDAFCFYYEGNLLALRDAGCEIVPFSPVSDRRLPPGTDAVYVGGGYPESFAEELAANTGLAKEMADRAKAGMPIYAECGGLMW